MLTRSKRKILFILSTAVFMVLVPVVILYALGYRLDENWSLKKTGGIFINSDISGSEIFIDGELFRKTNLLQSGAFINNLAPGEYEIAVLKEKYLPWKKTLKVRSQLVTEARSLLVPEQISAKVISSGNFSRLIISRTDPLIILSEEKGGAKIVRWFSSDREEFLTDIGPILRYRNSFEVIRWLPGGAVLRLDGKAERVTFNLAGGTAVAVPLGNESASRTQEEVLASSRRKDSRNLVEITYDQEKKLLWARWIESAIPPYYFTGLEEELLASKEIGNFEFYPGRSDVILATYDNALWAIEIDKRGGRTILPIYKGKDPSFGVVPGGDGIYILDNGILLAADLMVK